MQEKVHEELDCVLGEKSDVTETDLKEMVFLEQVRLKILTSKLVVAQLFR